MVGMETKNENSRAEARDMPASCPPAIVDMERELPGRTAEKIWQKPIQIACGRLLSSIFQVWMRLPLAPGPAVSDLALSASMSHITIPPISSDQPMIWIFSRCLPITLVSRKDGMAVTTNATVVRPSGCVNAVRFPLSPRGKVDKNLVMRLQK